MSNETPSSPFLSVRRLLVLLAIALVATGTVIWFAVARDRSPPEQIVAVLDERSASAVELNVGEILDATQQTNLTPVVGRRYRVRISGESRDGASMLARIGETLTFVKGGAKPGEIVEVEVTRLYRTTAEAIVLNRNPAADTAAAQPLAPSDATPRDQRPSKLASRETAPAATGEIYTGVVTRLGSRGDGAVEVGDRIVYIPGAQIGERVVFEITEKTERFWTGRLLWKLAPEGSSQTRPPSEEGPLRAPQVVEGAEFEVVVRERERRNPEKNGVARIDGLAVVVPDTRPGDRVKIRIVERRRTIAMAEIVERLPPSDSP